MNNELQNLSYCNDTLKLKEVIENSFLELGERLLKIRQQRLYEPQWTSFLEYVWTLEMDESSVSKLINIYEKFIYIHGFSRQEVVEAGGWSKLAEVIPFVVDKETAIYWLDKAKVLSRPDLRKETREARTGISQITCPHNERFVLSICRNCGDKRAILPALEV